MSQINETIKSIYENLNDEQREKMKACKTTDEIMEFMGKEGMELPDDLVEAVSGGCNVDDELVVVLREMPKRPTVQTARPAPAAPPVDPGVRVIV